MLGQMMHRPLSVIEILKFASENHKSAEIVSVRTEGDIHRYSYAQAFERVAQMAHALGRMGIASGDRVATLAGMGIAILNYTMRFRALVQSATQLIRALAQNR